MQKTRLDLLMVEKGLAESRSLAQRLVMAGQVRVNGQVELKPATRVDAHALVELELGPRFVSRGGEKLIAAFQSFNIDVSDCVCADIGASTGGFTDCLLQHGARRVYAIDVGYGILHWKLRNDPRVVVMERTNARFVERLPERIEFVTIDASFISLKLFLPVITAWFVPAGGRVVALIKPQFEAGKVEVNRGSGVIQDPVVHRAVVEDVLAYAQKTGYAILGLVRSPLRGPKGNTEFLMYLQYPGETQLEVSSLIDTVL
ncbi:MAG: TlyA family RNA methyltransferase [Anaerolineaceae bacterium]|nr:TlyA family RNA methyltransferase [Anaerolineaceae bacterium]